MRVTRYAHGSSDSKGTQPTVQMASFAPLAESQRRSRSYATFVTDVELQQATVGAEILECAEILERRIFAAKITNLKKKIHIFYLISIKFRPFLI